MKYIQLFSKTLKEKLFTLLVFFPLLLTPTAWAEDVMLPIKPEASITKVEQEVIDLSKTKWQWMADRNVDALDKLFHDKAVFVHMSRTMTKANELEVIRSGGIEYKKADIHEVSINIIGNTAILLNKITLLAVVRGNQVTNPFVVTEIYVKDNKKWKIASLSFTKLVTP